MSEEWRTIPSFPAYEVSETGKVRRSGRTSLIKAWVQGKYQRVTLRANGTRSNVLVHRMVALAFLGEPTGPIVRHLDDDQSNNHWTNLAYGTMADNKEDARRNGVSRNANMLKTHCAQGHPYDAANTKFHTANGWRRCKECHRQQSRRRKADAKRTRSMGAS